MTRVVVVGAGVAGLATAALLARDGHEVTVLEARDEVGGRAGTWESAGYRFDTGPSWYLMPECFDHFFRLLGTSVEEELDLVDLDPAYRVYFEGHPEPVDVRTGREHVRALFESIEPGSGDAVESYLASATDTYHLALRRFLYTSFASYLPLLRTDVLRRVPSLVPMLLRPLSALIDRTVTDHRLRQILGYPSVFLGSSPDLAPAIYHLMSHLDLTDGVRYPRGGFSTLVDALVRVAEREGVRIRTGHRVTGLRVTRDVHPRRRRRAQVTGVEVRGPSGADVVECEHVVGAADLHHLETEVVPRDLATYPREYWDRRTPGPGALLLFLGVRGAVPQLAHHTLMFTRDWDTGFEAIFGDRPRVPSPASLYVCRPTATDGPGSGLAPEGCESLFVLVPVPADPGIGADEQRAAGLADDVIAQIADWAGIDDLRERVEVSRVVTPADFASDLGSWRGTALGPAHTLRQSAFFRTGNRSRHIEGLWYAGASTLPGIGLPMCLISAELVVKHLRGDVSARPMSEPLTRER